MQKINPTGVPAPDLNFASQGDVTPKKNAINQAVANCASPIAGTPGSIPRRLEGLGLTDTPPSTGKRKRDTSPWKLVKEVRVRGPEEKPASTLSNTPTSKHPSANVYKTPGGSKVAISPASQQHLLNAQQVVLSNPESTSKAIVDNWNWLIENNKIHAAIISPDDVTQLIQSWGKHVSYYEENILDKLNRNIAINPLKNQGKEAETIKNIQAELQRNPAVALGQPIIDKGNMVYAHLNKAALAHLLNIAIDSPDLPELKTLITFSGASDTKLKVNAKTRQTHVNISWTPRRADLFPEKTKSLSIQLECAAIGFLEENKQPDVIWLEQEMNALTSMLKDQSDTHPIWLSSKLAEHLRSEENNERIISKKPKSGEPIFPFRAGYSLNLPSQEKGKKELSAVYHVPNSQGELMSPNAEKKNNRYDQGTSKAIRHDQCSEQRLLVPLYGLMAKTASPVSISKVSAEANLSIFSGRCSCLSCMGAITSMAMGHVDKTNTKQANGFGIRFLSTTAPSKALGILLTGQTQTPEPVNKQLF